MSFDEAARAVVCEGIITFSRKNTITQNSATQNSITHQLKTLLKATEKILALLPDDVNRVIEMAWEDRTPFDAIEAQFGLAEQEVITLMRRELKAASWRRWRARVQGRSTKHAALSEVDDARFHCTRQRGISLNKVSKR